MAVSTEPSGGQRSGPEPGDLLDRVQDLSERVEALEDPRARTLAQELASAIIAMYGDGLERIMAVVHGSREAGATILDELSQDGAVGSLLLIHDLYPVSLHDRVMEALDTVRPYMESHGGNVELVDLTDGVARLVLEGSCNGCSASRATLELAIKQALDEHAPDLAGLEVEGVVEEGGSAPASPVTGMALPMADVTLPMADVTLPVADVTLPVADVTLPVVQSAPPPPPPRWLAVDEARRPEPGGLREVTIADRPLLLADVGGSLLAYVDECAACGESLGTGALDGGMLRCAHCGAEFDLPHAGRAAGGEPLQLRPVPLLEDGGLRVAV